jgi:TnpA family transposase
MFSDASARFAFAPRIRDLQDKRLFIHGKPALYPGLQSIISTTSLNLKDIETHWRGATSGEFYKQGTVTASLMMKKLASYPKQNGLAKALRKLVASKGHCLCWTGSGILPCVDAYRQG